MKKVKFWKQVCKKSLALIACVMMVFSVSFFSYAGESSPSGIEFYLNASRIPVHPISASFNHLGNDSGMYNGTFVMDYMFVARPPYVINGYIDIQQLFSVYTVGSNSSYMNQLVIAIDNVECVDFYGNYVGFSSSFNVYSSYQVSGNTGWFASPSYSGHVYLYPPPGSRLSTYCNCRVTYSIQSNLPLGYVLAGVTSFSHTLQLSSEPVVGNDSSSLQSIANNTNTTNNKLQNLTDGYSDSAMNNTNQELSNQLGSYDQAEDAAIDSVTDYFGQIQQPISFFNASSFLTSTSFVWTYLQGIYEHLGDAKIVVDVVLALIVAFSFIGLGKYIWRVADREEDS